MLFRQGTATGTPVFTFLGLGVAADAWSIEALENAIPRMTASAILFIVKSFWRGADQKILSRAIAEQHGQSARLPSQRPTRALRPEITT
jgi:hypothetical protein